MDVLSHADQHAEANDAIEALETKIGIDSSADTDSVDYKLENHTHIESEITDFAHTHTESEITDFAHTHTESEISDLDHSDTRFNVFDTFAFECDNGTGTRSTRSTASYAEIPGFSNNAITPTVNCQVYGSLVMMGLQATAGAGRIALYLNTDSTSTSQLTAFGGCYFSAGGDWDIQTIPFCLDLDADITYYLTAYFYSSTGGTLTITNANNDQQYPTAIRGIILPRT
jgi:hypothetical protein